MVAVDSSHWIPPGSKDMVRGILARNNGDFVPVAVGDPILQVGRISWLCFWYHLAHVMNQTN